MTSKSKEMANPKVSVCITTYNHSNFITQALESVLAQKADFAFEVLVGEDGSNDGTRELVQRLGDQHPQRLRLFLNDRSRVIYINGQATGRWNLVNLISQARGEYIALLDGDDYWTDESKLQLQVKALDGRPDCSFAFHNAIELDDTTGRSQPFSGLAQGGEAPGYVQQTAQNGISEIGLPDLFFRWIVPTASIVFRRSMLGRLPDWFFEAISGDHTLQLLLARHGNALYLNRNMSVYRKHAGGITPRHGNVPLRRSWARMHHNFNRAADFQFDNLLADRLAREFEWTSDLRIPGNANALAAFYDVLLSRFYAGRSGRGSLWRSSCAFTSWLRNAAVATAQKTGKKLWPRSETQ